MRRLITVWMVLVFASGIAAAKAPTKLPKEFSLKAQFDDFGLSARQQGGRGTCVFFAVTAVADFEFAKSTGQGQTPFAEEYLVWAANESCKETGGNFAKAVQGLMQLGICDETLMPYGALDDVQRHPSAAARAAAKQHAQRWRAHYVPPSDLQDSRWLAVKKTLLAGHPLAAAFWWPKQMQGAAILHVPPASEKLGVHVVALVGYTDDATKPGGGVFHFRNSWGTGWGSDGYGIINYAYARTFVTDAFWLEYGAPNSEKPLVRFEGEKLQVTRAHLCEVSDQDMTPFNKHLWSGGHQLFANAKKGAVAEVNFKVASAGTYRLRVIGTRARDYGKVRFALDGASVGEVYDLYCDVVSPTSSLELGMRHLEAGTHSLRITVVDKNVQSTGYFFGIDAIDLCSLPK